MTHNEYTIERGTRWFECEFCDKTFKGTELSVIRKHAAKHLNEQHGKQLSRTHERVTTEQYGGDRIHENIYQVRRIPIYVTSFDILSPISETGYIAPSSSDSVCDTCGTRVTHDSPLEKVETEPDNRFTDEWECSACVKERDVNNQIQSNTQLTDYTTRR